MIGAASMESAILGRYADHVRAIYWLASHAADAAFVSRGQNRGGHTVHSEGVEWRLLRAGDVHACLRHRGEPSRTGGHRTSAVWGEDLMEIPIGTPRMAKME